jgi:hypothetical protein
MVVHDGEQMGAEGTSLAFLRTQHPFPRSYVHITTVSVHTYVVYRSGAVELQTWFLAAFMAGRERKNHCFRKSKLFQESVVGAWVVD